MTRSFFLSIVILFITGFYGCTSKIEKNVIESLFADTAGIPLQSNVKYAKGFDIYSHEGMKKVIIYHPEDHKNVLASCYVIDSLDMIKYNLKPSPNILFSPVTGVAVFSATQLNAIEKLNLLDRVVGISEAKYIKSHRVKNKLKAGDIVELATTADYFVEKILSVNPSVIFYTPYKFTGTHPLEKKGIPLIPFCDYYENDPLGRAEWIKFTAAFFGNDEQASELFREIETSYYTYKKMTDSLEIRPTVFSDKYFNDQWFVPGGKSYIAALLKDAGADYVWKDDMHTASLPLDYEVVYSKAYNADYWRIVGSYGDKGTYESLARENPLYERFKAFQQKQVIWCDAEATAYFEQGPLEPHILLADMIFAFHPELLKGYQPKYYHILK